MRHIVEVQQAARGIWFVFDNFGFMIVPFMIYFISAIAETNRAPFDLPEAESRTGRGFPHRVQRLPLGALHAVRVREHVRGGHRWR